MYVGGGNGDASGLCGGHKRQKSPRYITVNMQLLIFACALLLKSKLSTLNPYPNAWCFCPSFPSPGNQLPPPSPPCSSLSLSPLPSALAAAPEDGPGLTQPAQSNTGGQPQQGPQPAHCVPHAAGRPAAEAGRGASMRGGQGRRSPTPAAAVEVNVLHRRGDDGRCDAAPLLCRGWLHGP